MCNKTYVIDLKTLTISVDNNNKFFLCYTNVLVLCHSTSVSPACSNLFPEKDQYLQT